MTCEDATEWLIKCNTSEKSWFESFFSPHRNYSSMRWSHWSQHFGSYLVWSSQNKTEKYSSPALACLCVEWVAAEFIYTRTVRPDAACIRSYGWRHSHAYSTNAHAHNLKNTHTCSKLVSLGENGTLVTLLGMNPHADVWQTCFYIEQH